MSNELRVEMLVTHGSMPKAKNRHENSRDGFLFHRLHVDVDEDVVVKFFP